MPRKIAKRITPEYLHNAALYYLERFAASTGRLRSVLMQKIRRSCRDHSDQVEATLIPLIELEIETLTRIELLNDARLMEQLVEAYRARGVAERQIVQKLRTKGFAQNMIEEQISATREGREQAELDAARRYLSRRRMYPFALRDNETALKAKQRAYAALARQGYTMDVIEAAMKP